MIRFGGKGGLLVVVALLLVSISGPVNGQELERERPPRPGGPEAGIRGTRAFDVSAWGVGGQVRLPMALDGRLELLASGDLFRREERTDWQWNLDVAVRPGPREVVYLGSGLALANREFGDEEEGSTEQGVNIFAGVKAPGIRFRVRPYLEARWSAIGGDRPFRVSLGVNLPLGEDGPRGPIPRPMAGGVEGAGPATEDGG